MNTTATELIAVPGTRWESTVGRHAGSVVIIERESNGKVYFHQDKRVTVGMGKNTRSSDGTHKLDRTVFYRLYRPYGLRDMAAASGEPVPLLPLEEPAPPSPETVARTESWLAFQRDQIQLPVELPIEPTAEPAQIEKRCRMCQVVKPAAEFARGVSKDGLHTYCRPCDRDRKGNRRADRTKERPEASITLLPPPPSVETKRCPRCQQNKPASEFGRHALRKDGLQPYCRLCNNAYPRDRQPRKETPAMTGPSTTDSSIIEQTIRRTAERSAALFVATLRPKVDLAPAPAESNPNSVEPSLRWRIRVRVVEERELTLNAPTILDALANAEQVGKNVQVIGIHLEG